MTSYRNANPNASPYVLVTADDIPMAMPKGISAADVLLFALKYAESAHGPIRVYNDGTYVCTVSVDG